MTEHENAHAPFPPSASSRWIKCPASVTMSKNIPERPQSVYALEGTVCHDIAAQCLKQKRQAVEFLDQVIEGIEITQELVDGIQMYVDEVRGTAAEIKATSGHIEQQVTIVNDCWGTVDAILNSPDLLVITDLKMGRGVVVDVEDSYQLKLYAVGSLRFLHENNLPIPKEILLKVVQPRTPSPIRKMMVTREELAEWMRSEVLPAMERARAGETVCNPGESQCRWCPATAICTSQANYVLKEAQEAFAPFTEVPIPEELKDMNPFDEKAEPLMSHKMVARMLDLRPHIDAYLNSVQAWAMEEALKGNRIPGYKLVYGKSNRKWGPSESDVAKLLEGYDVDPFEQVLLTPAKAEKAMGKKKAKEADLEKYIVKPLGKTILVPESDTRPEIQDTVEDQFSEFVQETATGGNPPPPEQTPDLLKEPIVADDTSTEDLFTDVTLFPDEPEAAEASKPVAKEADDMVVLTAEGREDKEEPGKNTKRYQVFNAGREGRASLESIASTLSCTINQVKMHLRYINERDGWGYTIFGDGTYEVK